MLNSQNLIAAAIAAAVISPAVAQASSWTTDVSAADRAGFQLVYAKDLATASNNGAAVVYATDNSGSIANGSFDRVGYYAELTSTALGRQFIWISFDTLTAQANRTGVPNDLSGEFYQTNLADMTVRSNVAGIATGTGIQTGNIEFWSTNYAPPNTAGVPNANGNNFDFGDQATPGGYGSMQLHNYDLDGAGAGAAGQTLFAYNQWGGGGIDLGIGNRPTNDPDWTFASNGGIYSAKILEVYVTPEPGSLGLITLAGVALLKRRRA